MRIKKISPTTPANGNIENQYGTSQTNAYSENYANTTFATKDVATTASNGLMSATDKTRITNLFGAINVVRDPYYNNHANATATITFPAQAAYHIFYVTLYTRHSGIKNIRVEENSTGNAIDISEDTTINYGTITTSGLQLIISTQSWESIVFEIISLNIDTSSVNDVSITVGA